MRALALVAAGSLLAACGTSTSESDAAQAPSASPTASPTAADTPQTTTEIPTFPSGTRPSFAQHKGPWNLVLRDVRVGEHDGFDRVVVELAGTGTPGWDLRYVRTPRADGSGAPVDVGGDSVLRVAISGMTLRKGYPETPEDFLRGPRHFTPTGDGVVADVNVVGVFEGYGTVFVGIEGDRVPFRAFTLSEPSRLVVDVLDDGSQD